MNLSNTILILYFVLLAGVYIPFGDIARLKLMYSYDMAVTAGQTYTGPSNEISLNL